MSVGVAGNEDDLFRLWRLGRLAPGRRGEPGRNERGGEQPNDRWIPASECHAHQHNLEVADT